MPEPVDACAGWQERLADWLVAQVSPQDEAALADHLARCPGCAAEADSLLGVAAVTLGADPGVEPAWLDGDEDPPADLADRIVARVAAERRVSGRRRVAVALACVAAVVALAVVVSRDRSGSIDGEPVTFARLAPGVEAEATVAAEEGGSLVELTASGLEPGTTYALWLTPPGGGYRERVPAGTFRADEAGAVDVRLRSALPAEDAGRVWATTPGGQIAMDTEAA
jgi:hypothetical protein